MRSNWFWFMDLDGGGSPYIVPIDPLASHGLGSHVFSQISSFMDNSMYQHRHLSVPGSLAFEGAFNHIAKLAGAILFLFSSGTSTNITREIARNPHDSKSRSCESSLQVKHIACSRQNLKKIRFSFRPKVLSLAAALVPPFDNISSNVLAVPLDNTDIMVQSSCEVRQQGHSGLPFPDLNWRRHAVEPRTGIEFPMILDNILDGKNNSSLSSEVLVGTGSRTMKIIRIKSLKVYAFGFYVHPYNVCEKLGPKYASVSIDELNKRPDFYEDLLREDITMTVRLVVSCNGMKINTVRDAFEKSLRARLVKTNPDTDYRCIHNFGACFTQDIPLPAGTTIDFRQTADGKLITEIGGNQIGAVHSKDLCRAFFSMYIGDVPVSEQTKEEIGKNVANIIRRC